MNDGPVSPDMHPDSRCPQCGTPLAQGALAGLCPACLLKAGAAEDTITAGGGAPFVPPTVEELATKFPQLEILSLIGKGGMGAVYKARQKQLDRFVALKILPPGIGHDAAFAERFAREARALAKLSHPNIVTIHDFGQADGLFFLLMEFVDGMTLRQLLTASRIAPREALAIVPQICDALQFAHDHGIVHRDIKPENILLDRRGRVKVADFGLAKLIGGENETAGAEGGALDLTGATEAGKIMGTPQYMAPEQRDNPSEVDHRADIYALGVVFYQMLTGELPGKRIEAPSSKVSIDVRLDEVVLRALEKNPDLRYAQASIFKTQVENISRPPGEIPQETQGPSGSAGPDARDAGFWRRTLALLIDCILVSIVAFPFLIAMDAIAPGSVVVSVPFDWFTTERVIDVNPETHGNLEQQIVEVTVLGRWKYLYRDEAPHGNGTGSDTKSRQLIDPSSRRDLKTTDADDLEPWVLMIYWILMESSVLQGSIGKMIVGIRVVDRDGKRLSMKTALYRNAAKIVSAVIFGIGFLMAGWTKRKQALHDTMTGCFVTIVPPPKPEWMRKIDAEPPAPANPTPAGNKAGKVLAVLGVIFQMGSLLGIIGSVGGMMLAFALLKPNGIADPTLLSIALGHTMAASFIAWASGILGMVCMAVALTAARYRASLALPVPDGLQLAADLCIPRRHGLRDFLPYLLLEPPGGIFCHSRSATATAMGRALGDMELHRADSRRGDFHRHADSQGGRQRPDECDQPVDHRGVDGGAYPLRLRADKSLRAGWPARLHSHQSEARHDSRRQRGGDPDHGQHRHP